MLEMSDKDVGLHLVVERDPAPRDPRLVEDFVFQIVAWPSVDGAPHDWPDAETFLKAHPPGAALVIPLKRLEAGSDASMVVHHKPAGPDDIDGYAVASFSRLAIEMGLDAIDPAIRDEVLSEADELCQTELLAHEQYRAGDVHRFRVTEASGRVVASKGDLYGEELAEHIARETFDRLRSGLPA